VSGLLAALAVFGARASPPVDAGPESRALGTSDGSGVVVSHGDRSGQRVALTFDACSLKGPSRYDAAVIAALESAKVPATLFIGGHWAQTHPEQVKELSRNPLFELGNHTFDHPHMPRLSQPRQHEELESTQRILEDMTGHRPRYFRPPYGEVDAAVASAAARSGLTTIQFDVASGDPDKSFTRARLTKWVLHEAKPGSIIVMHMNGNGWHTAEALPEIIKGLRAKGFVLSTVGEMLGSDATPAALDAGR
jgi:peptidoglycan/xylan/chitin deacetylase (PgdA/CDA1 family)